VGASSDVNAQVLHVTDSRRDTARLGVPEGAHAVKIFGQMSMHIKWSHRNLQSVFQFT
jgi:hypothetical protein